jgi:hypothetical protein
MNDGGTGAPRRPNDADDGDDGRNLRAMLDAWTAGDPGETLRLRDLLAGLGRRAFGMLLFVATLPAFIPIPIGGAISGPLVVLIGFQLLLGRREPWLPRAIAGRGPHRHSLARFDRLVAPWLARLERLVRPRLPQLLHHRAAAVLTGLLLVLLGALLSLPIPFTNYLFGALLLLFALALLERDGALMAVAWVAGAACVGVFGLLSGKFAAMAAHGIDLLF